VTIRRLTRKDRAAVERLCARAGSEDFVPLYFERIIEEKAGFGFEEGESLCGIIFSTLVLDGEAWLFGLRVDPDHRRVGIGRCLTEHALKEVPRSCRLVRLGVFTDNRASMRLAGSFGFAERAQYVFRESKKTPSTAAAAADLKRVGPERLEEILARLMSDRRLQEHNLLLPHFYEWFRLTEESLAELIRNGWVWSVGEQLAVVSTELDDSEVEIGYLSDPCDRVLPAILERFSPSLIEASLPADPTLEEILERHGFAVPRWGSAITIYERELDQPGSPG